MLHFPIYLVLQSVPKCNAFYFIYSKRKFFFNYQYIVNIVCTRIIVKNL